MTAPHRDIYSTIPTNVKLWTIPIGKYAHLLTGCRWVNRDDHTDERFTYQYWCGEGNTRGQSHTQFVKYYDGSFPLCAACAYEWELALDGAFDAC